MPNFSQDGTCWCVHVDACVLVHASPCVHFVLGVLKLALVDMIKPYPQVQ